MAKARKNIQISEETWQGCNRLKRRYDTPISQLLENLILNSSSYEDLDRLFGYKKKRGVR